MEQLRSRTALPKLAALCIATLCHAAAWASPPSGEGATVRFQTYNSVNEVVFRVAEEKFCATYKIKCVGVLIPSGPLGVQALLGDSIQVGFAAADTQIRAISNGAQIQMISGFIDRLPYQIVIRNDVEQPSKGSGFPGVIRDLKGKRVGVTGRGAGVELTFDVLAREAGLPPTGVTYVAVGGPVTTMGAFKSKQIDAAIVFQPVPGMCRSAGVCSSVLSLTDGQGPASVQVFDGAATTVMAKKEFIEKNPEVIRAFVAAFQDAEQWIRDPKNFEELRAIAKRHIKIEAPDADDLMDAGLKEQVGNTNIRIKVSAIQAYIDLLYSRQLIQNRLEPRSILWRDAPTR